MKRRPSHHEGRQTRPVSQIPAAPDAFHVYDTTLRDGAQQEGLQLSVNDKLKIAR